MSSLLACLLPASSCGEASPVVVLAYPPQPWLLPWFSSNDTLGGCGCPEVRNASGRQIIGSSDWSLDTLLGGTTVPSCKMAKGWDQLAHCWIALITLGGCAGFASWDWRRLTKRAWVGGTFRALLQWQFGRACDCTTEWPWTWSLQLNIGTWPLVCLEWPCPWMTLGVLGLVWLDYTGENRPVLIVQMANTS